MAFEYTILFEEFEDLKKRVNFARDIFASAENSADFAVGRDL